MSPHRLRRLDWLFSACPVYFITACTHERRSLLANPEIHRAFREFSRKAEQRGVFMGRYVLMPDHLHALLSFSPSDKPIRRIISKWKEWTAKQTGIQWQLDFFEHRLRHDESRRQKANYILENPVRKNLVSRPEDWPYVYFGTGTPPKFED